MAVAAKKKSPWEDQFTEPTLEDLLAAYPKPNRQLFEHARGFMLGLDDVTETLGWQGLPWRWCLTFEIPKDPTRAWAYLVPDPERAKVAIPFNGEMLQAMPMHRFKRHLKDVFAGSMDVGGKFWPTFDISSRSQLEDVLDLVKRKYTLVTGRRVVKGQVV
jgi:hypothetical protein